MSEWIIREFKVEGVENHPNADRLDIITVDGGYPCIVKRGDFEVGDSAIYFPVDSILDVTRPEFAFLKKKENQLEHRLKAVRLRQIFSMGLIIPNPNGYTNEDNLEEIFGVKKWEPEMQVKMGGSAREDLGLIPKYDLDSLRKYKNSFEEEDTVIITEKLHGTWAGFIYSTEHGFVCKSHRLYRKESDEDFWWNFARENNLEEKCRLFPNVMFCGEIIGVQKGYRYGEDPGKNAIYFFDMFDVKTHGFVHFHTFADVIKDIDEKMVPILYNGKWLGYKWLQENYDHAKSTIDDRLICEGVVVQTPIEEFCRTGRKKLKYVSEDYLLNVK